MGGVVAHDGELSPEQREHLVTLLHLVDTAAELAAGRGEWYRVTRIDVSRTHASRMNESILGTP